MITEQVFREWAEIDDAGCSGNYWGTAACEFLAKKGGSGADAIDRVILLAIRLGGDLKPLAALFNLGCAPSPRVLRHLAKMIAPDLIGAPISHTLQTRRASAIGGRARSLEAIIRDELIARRIDGRGPGVKYESAVADLVDNINATLSPEYSKVTFEGIRRSAKRGRRGT